jgi:hypothetical protein
MSDQATNGRCLLCPGAGPMTAEQLLAHLADEHQLPTSAPQRPPGPRVHEVVWVQLRGTAS